MKPLRIHPKPRNQLDPKGRLSLCGVTHVAENFLGTRHADGWVVAKSA